MSASVLYQAEYFGIGRKYFSAVQPFEFNDKGCRRNPCVQALYQAAGRGGGAAGCQKVVND